MPTLRERIDPELAAALAALPMPTGALFDLRDIPGARAGIEAMAASAPPAPGAESVRIEVLEATRPDGPPVPVRVVRPNAGPGPLPTLLWFHGGGQVLGFAAQEDPFLVGLARAVGCVVASVDYRLAPEAPAPAAAEDGYAAYQWLCREAGALGVEPRRIGIAGASGGAGIAAAAVLMIRDRGAPTPRFQALNYPMLDDRNETRSSHEITDLGIWDRATNVRAWQAILGDRVGGPDVSPYCAAARADDLRGLPPTFLAVGELDTFRDEDLAYAAKLVVAGVPTELHLYPGAYHAWDLFAPESRLAAAFQQAWHGYLARQFRA